jgi:hypothetical protein
MKSFVFDQKGINPPGRLDKQRGTPTHRDPAGSRPATDIVRGCPTLLDELIVHDLIDEMCLTLAPRMAGPQPLTREQSCLLDMPRKLTLEHVLSHEDYLYLRYGRGPK